MDIIMCGVGGQGTVLTSRVVGEAAIKQGYEVRTSEIIGMAQREGPVVSQVRIGTKLHGPLIPDISADYLLGFELAEAVRNLDKLNGKGRALVNTHMVVPPTVYLGISNYPEEQLIDYLKEQTSGLILINANELAAQAGSSKAVSAVMLGAFATLCPDIDETMLLKELLARLPERVQEINTRAFRLGKEFVEGETR
ncbi:MAG: indolepyruvate oxidoreductase subunit beta [Syntrophomonadaceae bacterium]|jgi:indolepyruvate ferredoxin oxidoreductase beta subunit|nr:indolepyruvate oxidoreductase subunit beta [Syntrophomonadaceae bacterium]